MARFFTALVKSSPGGTCLDPTRLGLNLVGFAGGGAGWWGRGESCPAPREEARERPTTKGWG